MHNWTVCHAKLCSSLTQACSMGQKVCLHASSSRSIAKCQLYLSAAEPLQSSGISNTRVHTIHFSPSTRMNTAPLRPGNAGRLKSRRYGSCACTCSAIHTGACQLSRSIAANAGWLMSPLLKKAHRNWGDLDLVISPQTPPALGRRSAGC